MQSIEIDVRTGRDRGFSRPDAGLRAVRRRGVGGRRRPAVRVRPPRDGGRRDPRARAPARTPTRCTRSTACCRATTAGPHRHGSHGHGADHVLPLLAAPSITVPVLAGRLALGTWQSIALLDPNADNATRHVRLSFLAG